MSSINLAEWKANQGAPNDTRTRPPQTPKTVSSSDKAVSHIFKHAKLVDRKRITDDDTLLTFENRHEPKTIKVLIRGKNLASAALKFQFAAYEVLATKAPDSDWYQGISVLID